MIPASAAYERCSDRLGTATAALSVARESTSARVVVSGADGDRWCDDHVVVPTISRFLGLVITMYFDDHDPPHFHALHADGEAKVRIDSLEAIDSTLSRRHLRFVLAWAELHQDELLENWRRARAGATLHAIQPLQ